MSYCNSVPFVCVHICHQVQLFSALRLIWGYPLISGGHFKFLLNLSLNSNKQPSIGPG